MTPGCETTTTTALPASNRLPSVKTCVTALPDAEGLANGKTSRAAIYTGLPGVLELQSFETPAPGPEEILIRIEACVLGRRSLRSMTAGDRNTRPTVFGMEMCGHIESFGARSPQHDSAGEAIAVGSRIVWASTTACDECFCCKQGMQDRCLRAIRYGANVSQDERLLFGGLASHCLLKKGTRIFKIPPRLPVAIAAQISGSVSTAAAALDASGQIAGTSVLIVGASVTGLTLAAMARERGAAHVVVTDLNVVRCKRAGDFGATCSPELSELPVSISGITGGYGIDTIIDVTGDPKILDVVLPVLRMGGTVVLLRCAGTQEPASIPLAQIVARHLTVKGIDGYQACHLASALEFMTANHYRYPFTSNVASWWPLTQIQEAVQEALNPEIHRVGVRPDSESPRTVI